VRLLDASAKPCELGPDVLELGTKFGEPLLLLPDDWLRGALDE
jgi:hypothetical protein